MLEICLDEDVVAQSKPNLVEMVNLRVGPGRPPLQFKVVCVLYYRSV